MSDSMSRSSDRLRLSGEGPRQARPTTTGPPCRSTCSSSTTAAARSRTVRCPRWTSGCLRTWRRIWISSGRSALLEENGEYVDVQALTPARTWVRHGGPDAAPVTSDGPLPETSDLVAGWYMIDVESHERAVERAAYVSSEPGPGGEPLYEWIDVREVMSEAPSDDCPGVIDEPTRRLDEDGLRAVVPRVLAGLVRAGRGLRCRRGRAAGGAAGVARAPAARRRRTPSRGPPPLRRATTPSSCSAAAATPISRPPPRWHLPCAPSAASPPGRSPTPSTCRRRRWRSGSAGPKRALQGRRLDQPGDLESRAAGALRGHRVDGL